MKTNNQAWFKMAFFLFLPAMACAQISYYSLFTSPARPLSEEIIEITLSNSFHNCCVNYDSQAVMLEKNDIYLFYSASNVANPCMCPSPGFSYYETGPLDAGKYNVYVVEEGIHCPPGMICIGTMLAPENVGEIKVLKGKGTDDTYLIDRTTAACKTLPCPYFTVYDITTGDSIPVAGVKGPDGEYVCIGCKIFIPWIDGNVQVKGYFDRDSLEDWTFNDVTFVVTAVLAEVPVSDPKERIPSSAGSPWLLSRSTGNELIIYLMLPGTITVYNTESKVLFKTECISAGEFVWDICNMQAGVYTIQLTTDDMTYSRILLLP
jgi:hypothetical protein